MAYMKVIFDESNELLQPQQELQLTNPTLPNPLDFDNPDNYFEALAVAETLIKDYEEEHGTLTNLQKMPKPPGSKAPEVVKKSTGSNELLIKHKTLLKELDHLKKTTHTEEDIKQLLKSVCKSLKMEFSFPNTHGKNGFMNALTHFLWQNFQSNESEPQDQ